MHNTEFIIFDDLAYMWTKDKDFNRAFLKHLLEYWKDCLTCRGYIYLDKIYESLGISWDPDDENVCYRKGENVEFSFKECEDKNSFKIEIACNY